MIKALVFDLDGTLIQTEVLKARSYAQAIQRLTSGGIAEEVVIHFFNGLVGLPREQVVRGLVQEYQTELQQSSNALTPEELETLLITERLGIYHKILSDEKLLSQHFCPYTLALLKKAIQRGFQTVLATMSHRELALKVLKAMGVEAEFDLILTRDDVVHGKPDPEIYLRVSDLLKLRPKECVVIEDSVNGIKAALAAKMPVFALTNSVTKNSVHQSALLDSAYVIDNLDQAENRIFSFIEESARH